uniref:Uncharacterized protein n=1 Tax=Kalanchoe fedtschenkoi TaxID=63787 RepID=A0A7N0ZY42_KALFE
MHKLIPQQFKSQASTNLLKDGNAHSATKRRILQERLWEPRQGECRKPPQTKYTTTFLTLNSCLVRLSASSLSVTPFRRARCLLY